MYILICSHWDWIYGRVLDETTVVGKLVGNTIWLLRKIHCSALPCERSIFKSCPLHRPTTLHCLGFIYRKSELKWQLTAAKGTGMVVCLPFSTPCMPFPLLWLWGVIGILSEWICVTKLAKKMLLKKKVGVQIVHWFWCAFTHKNLMCWPGSRRHECQSRAKGEGKTMCPKRVRGEQHHSCWLQQGDKVAQLFSLNRVHRVHAAIHCCWAKT